jgi:hypothetical protein
VRRWLRTARDLERQVIDGLIGGIAAGRERYDEGLLDGIVRQAALE